MNIDRIFIISGKKVFILLIKGYFMLEIKMCDLFWTIHVCFNRVVSLFSCIKCKNIRRK